MIHWLLYCTAIQVTHLDDFGRQLHARISVIHPIHSTGKSGVTFIGLYISYLFTGLGWQVLCSSNVWYQPVAMNRACMWCSLAQFHLYLALFSSILLHTCPLTLPLPSTHTLTLTFSHSPHIHSPPHIVYTPHTHMITHIYPPTLHTHFLHSCEVFSYLNGIHFSFLQIQIMLLSLEG